jgi:hypothetical protein
MQPYGCGCGCASDTVDAGRTGAGAHRTHLSACSFRGYEKTGLSGNEQCNNVQRTNYILTIQVSPKLINSKDSIILSKLKRRLASLVSKYLV